MIVNFKGLIWHVLITVIAWIQQIVISQSPWCPSQFAFRKSSSTGLMPLQNECFRHIHREWSAGAITAFVITI